MFVYDDSLSPSFPLPPLPSLIEGRKWWLVVEGGAMFEGGASGDGDDDDDGRE